MNLFPAANNGILVCEGAMGTMLHAAGNSLDQALPALNLSSPHLVRTVHDSYIDAGVDIVQTNTFGASRLRLSEYDHGDQVEEINRAGVHIARAAAETGRQILVAGSVGPAVSVRQRRRATPAERAAALREQLAVLVEAGIDLVLLETFGYLDELVEAVQNTAELAAGTELPVIAQATFSDNGHMLSGHTPGELARALSDLPVTALGTNCTLGPQGILNVLRELREHTTLPLSAQPNAGLPRRVSPGHFEYDLTSDYFVRYVRQLLDSGAAVIGGCCGTTPRQLADVVAVVTEYRAAPLPPPPAEVSDAPAPTAGREYPVIVELSPPVTGGVEDTADVVATLYERGVGSVAVAPADAPRAQVTPADLALHLQHQLGVEAIASMTAWDRTIMALQADLLGAHALGVRSIVCETGTPPLLGDYPHVDGIWDVDSIGLIELLAGLNDGRDYYGLPMPNKTTFRIGARINPGSRELDRAEEQARAKIAAGAHFLITRPIYELSGLHRMLEAIGEQRVPVYAAIRPLTSFDEADYLANEVPDVTIPASTLEALRRAGGGAAEAGLDLATDLVVQVRHLADGLVLGPSVDPVAAVDRLLGTQI